MSASNRTCSQLDKWGEGKGGGSAFFIQTGDTDSEAALHGCLPRLLGDRDKEIKIVSGEEKNYFVMGWPVQPRQDESILYRHDEPNQRVDRVLGFSTVVGSSAERDSSSSWARVGPWPLSARPTHSLKLGTS